MRPSIHDVKRRYVLSVLRALGGNMTETCRVLQIDGKTLYNWLRRWGWVMRGNGRARVAPDWWLAGRNDPPPRPWEAERAAAREAGKTPCSCKDDQAKGGKVKWPSFRGE